ncbi:MAG: hypothetical protein ACREBH_01215 [Candidatus Micrarchaeaceae archaeon]
MPYAKNIYKLKEGLAEARKTAIDMVVATTLGVPNGYDAMVSAYQNSRIATEKAYKSTKDKTKVFTKSIVGMLRKERGAIAEHGQSRHQD